MFFIGLYERHKKNSQVLKSLGILPSLTLGVLGKKICGKKRNLLQNLGVNEIWWLFAL